MIKLVDILKEIRVVKPVPNNLNRLLRIQKELENADSEKKKELSLEAAKLVLPIWEYYYPNDKRPRNAVENPSEGTADAAYDAANDTTYNLAATYSAASAASAASATVYATSYSNSIISIERAIKATKAHFNSNK